ncbi:MAG: YfiT family bacillithiol transferase [Acidobacteriota bacterium]
MDDLRYPIGRFEAPVRCGAEDRAAFITQIDEAPARLREAVSGLSPEQLREPYRDGGWTLAQVVHHVADSHVNAYVRSKLTATADNPLITAYDETRWAALPDATSADIEVSLRLLGAIHVRWVAFLRGLAAAQFDRTFQHSELGPVSLNRMLALYAWHGRHHTAHITGLRQRRGW